MKMGQSIRGEKKKMNVRVFQMASSASGSNRLSLAVSGLFLSSTI